MLGSHCDKAALHLDTTANAPSLRRQAGTKKKVHLQIQRAMGRKRWKTTYSSSSSPSSSSGRETSSSSSSCFLLRVDIMEWVGVGCKARV